MSYPPIVAVPFVGLVNVASIRMVVVFPAPFGPSKPKISHSLTSNEMLSTAVKSPNFFVRFFTSIIVWFSKLSSPVLEYILLQYISPKYKYSFLHLGRPEDVSSRTRRKDGFKVA